jgi:hypothetical protein
VTRLIRCPITGFLAFNPFEIIITVSLMAEFSPYFSDYSEELVAELEFLFSSFEFNTVPVYV